jgi:Lipocalin-like domain
MMSRDQFIGVWKLTSFEFRLADGIVIHPMGSGVVGVLMYESSGYMALHLMEPDRPKFESGDWLRGTPEEIKAAFEGCMAYYGTFEVDEPKSMIIHHVHGSTFPNWVGVDREQFYECSRDRLTLTTLPMTLAGEQAVGVLIFQRAK